MSNYFLEDLKDIAPLFLLMGVVFISAYLAPYILGKIDDWKGRKIPNS